MIRRRSTSALSAEQARHAVGVLIQEGASKPTDLVKSLQRRERMIRALRASLAALEAGAVRIGRQFRGSPFAAGRSREPPRARRNEGSVESRPRLASSTSRAGILRRSDLSPRLAGRK